MVDRGQSRLNVRVVDDYIVFFKSVKGLSFLHCPFVRISLSLWEIAHC